MGFEPEEEEIPMDPSDLNSDCTYALLLFKVLPDVISDMSGMWLGKNFSGLMDIMNIYNISDKRNVFELLLICCSEYEKFYEEQRKIQERKM